MESIINNTLLQLGAIGMLIAALTMFSIYLVKFVMKQISIKDEELKDKENENRKIESEYRDYLRTDHVEMRKVIERNADIVQETNKTMTKLIELINLVLHGEK